MVGTIERDAAERLAVQLIGYTKGTFLSIGGALGEDGFEAMQAWLRSLAEPVDGPGELPYELDPNARPDANFMAMMAQTREDGGGMDTQRVKAEEMTGPFADRLREVIAAKASPN